MNYFLRTYYTLIIVIAWLSNTAQGYPAGAQQKIDSLKNEIAESKDDTNKVIKLNKLGSIFLELGDYDQSTETSNASVELSKKINYKKGLSAAYSNLGVLYDYRGDYIRSIDYHNRSLTLNKEIGNLKGIGASYGNLAIVYEYLGKLPEALNCHYDALKIDEKIGNKYGIGVTYINLGSVYVQLLKYDEGLKCYQKALNNFTELKAKDGIAYAESGIGMIKMHQHNTEEAQKHIAISKSIFEELGDKQNMAGSLVNLGQLYVNAKKLKEAEVLYKESLKLNIEMQDQRNLAYSYMGLANVNMQYRNYSKAKTFIDSAITIAGSIGCIECLKEGYDFYVKLDSNQSNFKDGFIHLQKFNLYKDSLINQENNKKSSQAKLQYDFDKKAAADSVKNFEFNEREELRHKQEITEQKTYSYGAAIGFILMVVIAGISYRAYKQKQKANVIIEEQKAIVDEKQKEIMDSINYAKRIQYTLLANHNLMDENLPNYFVYFKPKAVVSGDFYWATKKGNSFYLAVCDSTGHGVPGAFMSLLNISFLNEAINEKNIKEPNLILNHVRQRLIESMDGGRDGMDAILICLNSEKNNITYSAANNEPVLIHNGQLTELAKDKMPVGKGEKYESFNLHSIDLQKGDSIYLYTDGFADQFGGPKGKKFKYKELNKLLLSNNNLSMQDQETALDKTFTDWKAEMEQVDDVCIIGIKI